MNTVAGKLLSPVVHSADLTDPERFGLSSELWASSDVSTLDVTSFADGVPSWVHRLRTQPHGILTPLQILLARQYFDAGYTRRWLARLFARRNDMRDNLAVRQAKWNRVWNDLLS